MRSANTLHHHVRRLHKWRPRAMRCLTSAPQKAALSLLHMLLDYQTGLDRLVLFQPLEKKMIFPETASTTWHLITIPKSGYLVVQLAVGMGGGIVRHDFGQDSFSSSCSLFFCSKSYPVGTAHIYHPKPDLLSGLNPLTIVQSPTSPYCRSGDGSHHLLVSRLSSY